MKNEYIEEVAILRRYIKKGLPEKKLQKDAFFKKYARTATQRISEADATSNL